LTGVSSQLPYLKKVKRKNSSPSGFGRALGMLALALAGIGAFSLIFAVAMLNQDLMLAGAALAAAAVSIWGLIVVSAIRS
jgi:hypothetical protein